MAMSSLQLGLAIGGGLVLAAVVAMGLGHRAKTRLARPCRQTPTTAMTRMDWTALSVPLACKTQV